MLDLCLQMLCNVLFKFSARTVKVTKPNPHIWFQSNDLATDSEGSRAVQLQSGVTRRVRDISPNVERPVIGA